MDVRDVILRLGGGNTAEETHQKIIDRLATPVIPQRRPMPPVPVAPETPPPEPKIEPRMFNSLRRGTQNLQNAGIVAGLYAGVVSPEDAFASIAKNREEMGLYPMDEKTKKGFEEIANSKGIFDALKNYAKNPRAAAAMIGETLPLLVAQIPAQFAGGLVGSVGGPVGALAGAAAATGATSAALDGTLSLLDSLQEQGYDISDEESLREAFASDEVMAKAEDYAVKRGVSIGVIDAITLPISVGIANRALKPMKGSKLKQAAKRTGIASAALGTEATGGSLGEMIAQLATDDYNPGEIVGEGIAELGLGAGQIITSARPPKETKQKPKQEPPTPPPEETPEPPPQEPPPSETPPEQTPPKTTGQVKVNEPDGLTYDGRPIPAHPRNNQTGTVSENQSDVPEGFTRVEFPDGDDLIDSTSLEQASVVEDQPVNEEPTEAQKEAGNYQKGHTKLHGFDITIENKVGSERKGRDSDGEEWSVKMPADYGYIRRTEGADGDQVDVYVGPQGEDGKIFVVDQVNPENTEFDEHKIIMGVPDEMTAEELYNAGFSDGKGPKRNGGITEVSPEQFKQWIDKGDTTVPFSQIETAEPVEEKPVVEEQTVEDPKEETQDKRLEELQNISNELDRIPDRIGTDSDGKLDDAIENLRDRKLNSANLEGVDHEAHQKLHKEINKKIKDIADKRTEAKKDETAKPVEDKPVTEKKEEKPEEETPKRKEMNKTLKGLKNLAEDLESGKQSWDDSAKSEYQKLQKEYVSYQNEFMKEKSPDYMYEFQDTLKRISDVKEPVEREKRKQERLDKEAKEKAEKQSEAKEPTVEETAKPETDKQDEKPETTEKQKETEEKPGTQSEVVKEFNRVKPKFQIENKILKKAVTEIKTAIGRAKTTQDMQLGIRKDGRVTLSANMGNHVVLEEIGTHDENISATGFIRVDQKSLAKWLNKADRKKTMTVQYHQDTVQERTYEKDHNNEMRAKYNDKERNLLTVSYGTSKLNLFVLDPDAKEGGLEYDQDAKGISTVIDGDVLSGIMDKQLKAISSEESRYYLNGVYVKFKDGIATFVSTQGHVLITSELKIDTQEETDFIIPRDIIPELIKLKREGRIEITYRDGVIEFRDGKTLKAKSVGDNFPDWTKVMPQNLNYRVTYDREQFNNALKQIKFKGDRLSMVKMEVDGSTTTVGHKNPSLGAATVELPSKTSDGKMVVYFNNEYNPGEIIDTDDLTFRVSNKYGSTDEPLQVDAENQGVKTTVVFMPMRGERVEKAMEDDDKKKKKKPKPVAEPVEETKEEAPEENKETESKEEEKEPPTREELDKEKYGDMYYFHQFQNSLGNVPQRNIEVSKDFSIISTHKGDDVTYHLGYPVEPFDADAGYGQTYETHYKSLKLGNTLEEVENDLRSLSGKEKEMYEKGAEVLSTNRDWMVANNIQFETQEQETPTENDLVEENLEVVRNLAELLEKGSLKWNKSVKQIRDKAKVKFEKLRKDMTSEKQGEFLVEFSKIESFEVKPQWHADEVTEKQLKMLDKLNTEYELPEYDREKITKGEASELISQAKEGAYDKRQEETEEDVSPVEETEVPETESVMDESEMSDVFGIDASDSDSVLDADTQAQVNKVLEEQKQQIELEQKKSRGEIFTSDEYPDYLNDFLKTQQQNRFQNEKVQVPRYDENRAFVVNINEAQGQGADYVKHYLVTPNIVIGVPRPTYDKFVKEEYRDDYKWANDLRKKDEALRETLTETEKFVQLIKDGKRVKNENNESKYDKLRAKYDKLKEIETAPTAERFRNALNYLENFFNPKEFSVSEEPTEDASDFEHIKDQEPDFEMPDDVPNQDVAQTDENVANETEEVADTPEAIIDDQNVLLEEIENKEISVDDAKPKVQAIFKRYEEMKSELTEKQNEIITMTFTSIRLAAKMNIYNENKQNQNQEKEQVPEKETVEGDHKPVYYRNDSSDSDTTAKWLQNSDLLRQGYNYDVIKDDEEYSLVKFFRDDEVKYQIAIGAPRTYKVFDYPPVIRSTYDMTEREKQVYHRANFWVPNHYHDLKFVELVLDHMRKIGDDITPNAVKKIDEFKGKLKEFQNRKNLPFPEEYTNRLNKAFENFDKRASESESKTDDGKWEGDMNDFRVTLNKMEKEGLNAEEFIYSDRKYAIVKLKESDRGFPLYYLIDKEGGRTRNDLRYYLYTYRKKGEVGAHSSNEGKFPKHTMNSALKRYDQVALDEQNAKDAEINANAEGVSPPTIIENQVGFPMDQVPDDQVNGGTMYGNIRLIHEPQFDQMPQMAQTLNEWAKMLGLTHEIVLNNTLWRSTDAEFKELADGRSVISVRPGGGDIATLQMIAHELGHMLMYRGYNAESKSVRVEIANEYLSWKYGTKFSDDKKLVKWGLKKPMSERDKFAYPKSLKEYIYKDKEWDELPKETQQYLNSFNEWFANQVARWATTNAKPVSAIEKFFKGLAEKLAQLFKLFRKETKAEVEFEKWINSWVERVAAGQAETVDPQRTPIEGASPPKQAELDKTPFSPTASNIRWSWMDKVRKRLQQFEIYMRRVQDALERYRGSKLPESQDVVMHIANYAGKVADREIRLKEEFIDPISEKIGKYRIDVKDIDDYLTARHAEERDKLVLRRDPKNDNGSGMKPEVAKKILEKWNGNKEMAEIVDLVDKMNRSTRRGQYKDGLISKETLKEWEGMFKHYVPLKGWEEDSESEAVSGKGYSVFGKEAKTILGRTTRSHSPLVYSIMQARQYIVRAEKNKVGQAFYELVEKNPDQEMWVPAKMIHKRRLNKDTGLVEHYYSRPSPWSIHGNYFMVKLDGIEKWVEVKDDELFDVLQRTGMSLEGRGIRLMMRAMGTLAALSTKYNPEFVLLTNFARDIQTGVINSMDIPEITAQDRFNMVKEALTYKRIRSIWKALVKKDKDDPNVQMYLRFRKAGGQTGWTDVYDLEQTLKQLQSELNRGALAKRIDALTDFIDHIATGVENGVRLSLFAALVDKGVSDKRAAYLARELTVNFNKKGTWGPALNMLYLFYNASIQGGVRVVKALGHRKVQYAAGGIVALSALTYTWNEMVSGMDDDDENDWLSIPDWIKERNMVFMLPNSKAYVTIPMPYVYNAFWALGNNIMDMVFQRKDIFDASWHQFSATVGSLNPLGSSPTVGQFLSPTFIDPFMQISENKSWHGGPLAPTKYEQHQPDVDLHFDSVNELTEDFADIMSKATGGDIGKAGFIDVSPESIEHLIEFAGSGLARFGNNLFFRTGGDLLHGNEVDARHVPFTRILYGNTGSVHALRSEFREAFEVVKAARYRLNAIKSSTESREVRKDAIQDLIAENMGDLAMFRKFNSVNDSLSDLRESRELALLQPAAEQKQILDKLKLKETRMLETALEMYKTVQEKIKEKQK